MTQQFGHQNDVSRSVSGIFGIDSLGLFGSEAGGTDAKTALKMASAP